MAHKGGQSFQNKSTVTADCVLYISASQGVEVCVSGGAVYARPCMYLHLNSYIQILFPHRWTLEMCFKFYPLFSFLSFFFFCPWLCKSQLAAWVEFLNLYKILMYIFIRRLSSHYTLHPSPCLPPSVPYPLKTEDFLSLLGSQSHRGRFLGLVSLMEFSHLYFRR